MRGTDGRGRGDCDGERITPACAGNRKKMGVKAGVPEDHPRVCGEQEKLKKIRNLQRGSPPRVRGTEPHFHGLLRGHGITPACAGNSVVSDESKSLCQDHPRVCGEQILPLLSQRLA